MRIVVVGATGNVGTSLLAALRDEGTHEVVGLARRPPRDAGGVDWIRADIRYDDLVADFRGADAVVHLAWAIQPSHDLTTLRSVNVDGSRRVFDAVARAGVRSLVYASSVGTYAAGPVNRRLDESWPATGIPTSFYSRHKAEVEAMLDMFEEEQPSVRVVRLRPGLIFKRQAGAEIAGLFLGRLVPRLLADPKLIPVVPDHPRLRFQAVHSLDVGQAYRLAVESDERGAFNVAADPVLDGPLLARTLDARAVRVPAAVMRGAAWATWKLRLQPTPPGWVDMALGVPLMDWSRARDRLGWEPTRTSVEALLDVMDGMREGATAGTPSTAGHGAAPV
jgi:nucleoside-diphosphate-sugar epimerase